MHVMSHFRVTLFFVFSPPFRFLHVDVTQDELWLPYCYLFLITRTPS